MRRPLFLHFSHLLVEVVMVLLPSTLQAWGRGCVSHVLSLHRKGCGGSGNSSSGPA